MKNGTDQDGGEHDILWDGLPPQPLRNSVISGGKRRKDRAMDVKVIGIDLGKNVCSLVALDAAGRVVIRRRLRPASVVGFVDKLPSCVIGMEACCGAHHLGRQMAGLGHEVRLMPPEYVKEYVKRKKLTTGTQKKSRRQRHGQ